MNSKTSATAAAMLDALRSLARVKQTIETALASLDTSAPEPMTRRGAAVRTTSTQIMAVLLAASEPLTLIDIADGVVALRQGEDEPKGGSTRYRELCRTSLARLVNQGVVERVPPSDRAGLMRFQRMTDAMR